VTSREFIVAVVVLLGMVVWLLVELERLTRSRTAWRGEADYWRRVAGDRQVVLERVARAAGSVEPVVRPVVITGSAADVMRAGSELRAAAQEYLGGGRLEGGPMGSLGMEGYVDCEALRPLSPDEADRPRGGVA
jgi:hypothetical protein